MSWGGPKCRHRSQQCMYCCDCWLLWKSCLSGCCLDTDLRKCYLGSDLVTCGRIPWKAPTGVLRVKLLAKWQVSGHHQALASSEVSCCPVAFRHVTFCRYKDCCCDVSTAATSRKSRNQGNRESRGKRAAVTLFVYPFVLTCELLYVGRGCLGVSARYLLTSRAKHPGALLAYIS
jgi:hypothetical protein